MNYENWLASGELTGKSINSTVFVSHWPVIGFLHHCVVL